MMFTLVLVEIIVCKSNEVADNTARYEAGGGVGEYSCCKSSSMSQLGRESGITARHITRLVYHLLALV